MRRYQVRPVPDPAEPAAHGSHDQVDPAEQVLKRLDAAAVAAAMQRLTGAQSDVLALRFAAGLSVEEVAVTVGKPVPDLSRRYADAVAGYQDRLAQASRDGQDMAPLTMRAEQELRTHHDVLTGLATSAPTAAQPGLQRAIDASAGAVARIPADIGPPEGVPPRPPGPAATPGRPTR